MKDFDVGQTLTFFYDCNITEKDYNKVLKLEYDNKAISSSITEINIPASSQATGSFTVKALKAGKTKVKINLEKSKELTLTVIAKFVLDPKKVKIAEITTTGLTITGKIKKLAVYQNKLYLLDSTGSSSTRDFAKFYSSPDGITWTDLGEPTDKNIKLSDQDFDTTVHKGKLWVTGQRGRDGQYKTWNFDGKNWKVGNGKEMQYGSLVSFENTLYQIAGSKKIYAYENSQWKELKHTFASKFIAIDSVVFNNKIWIVGGNLFSGGRIKTVSTFDGKTYQNVANLPKKSMSAAVEVFPRGLLALAGQDDQYDNVSAVFYSRFGKTWTEITGITNQSKLQGIRSGGTVVWNGALWAVNRESKKILKITYKE